MENMNEHASVIYGTHFPNRLFVGCLPEAATALELGNHFNRYGKVAEAKILKDDCGRSKRFGFVSFQNEESVKTVLEARPIRFKGKVINVGPAVKKDGTETPRSRSPNISMSASKSPMSDETKQERETMSPPGIRYHVPHMQHHYAVLPMMPSHQPMMTSHQPMMTSHQPMMTSHQPMMTSHQPLMTKDSHFTRSSLQMPQYAVPMTMTAYQYHPTTAYSTSNPCHEKYSLQLQQPLQPTHTAPFHFQHTLANRLNGAVKELDLNMTTGRKFHDQTMYNPYVSSTFYPSSNCIF